MTATTFHKVRSSHPEDDALGRVFGPGELIPDLDVEDAYNKEKIAAGVFFEVGAPDEASPPDEGSSAPDATEAAARLAEENGVDLATISGSGKRGRIVESDVEAAVEARSEVGESDDEITEGDD